MSKCFVTSVRMRTTVSFTHSNARAKASASKPCSPSRASRHTVWTLPTCASHWASLLRARVAKSSSLCTDSPEKPSASDWPGSVLTHRVMQS